MSDVIFVVPYSSYDPCVDAKYFSCYGGNAVAAAGSRTGHPASQPAALARERQRDTHMMLYEWIRKFVEGGWRKQYSVIPSLQEIGELETTLRELIYLDESQVRMNCITRDFMAYRQSKQQQRESRLLMMEELSKYRLRRLLYLEQRMNNDNKYPQQQQQQEEEEHYVTLQELEEQLMEDLQERLSFIYTPALSQARSAEKSAQDRLQAVMRVLQEQQAKLQETQGKLNTLCRGINELAAYTQVEVRCEDNRGSAHAAIRATHAHMSAPPLVITALKEKISALQSRSLMATYHTLVSEDSQSGFDALTMALQHLEETRGELYRLQRQITLYEEQLQAKQEPPQQESKTVFHLLTGDYPTLVPSSLSTLPGGTANDLLEGFSMESYNYELQQTVLQEQRRFFSTMKSLKGVHTILLPLSDKPNAELYTQNLLPLFVGQSLSLHQWMHAENTQPIRYAAVFYPLSPKCQSELPKEHLEYLLRARAGESHGKLKIIDLRSAVTEDTCTSGNTRSDVYLSANAVRFSADGSFMYVCLGPINGRDKTEHLALLRLVDVLREGLQVPSTHCFSFYTPMALGVGWAAAGITAWALSEMFFTSPAEEQRFITHLRDTYDTVIDLTPVEVQNFAGECVEVVLRPTGGLSLRRRLIISARAFRSLSEHNRALLTSWYTNKLNGHGGNNTSGGGYIVPDLSMIEGICGYSAVSMIVSTITHGSTVPPPVNFGILSFVGIGVNT